MFSFESSPSKSLGNEIEKQTITIDDNGGSDATFRNGLIFSRKF